MTVEENPNIKSVSEYKVHTTLKKLLRSAKTKHSRQRRDRIETMIEINDGAEIDRRFLVDKGHSNGAEIHSVTKNGCIFVSNERTSKFITVLIARPNQIIRLYRACGLWVDKSIVAKSVNNAKNKLYKI